MALRKTGGLSRQVWVLIALGILVIAGISFYALVYLKPKITTGGEAYMGDMPGVSPVPTITPTTPRRPDDYEPTPPVLGPEQITEDTCIASVKKYYARKFHLPDENLVRAEGTVDLVSYPTPCDLYEDLGIKQWGGNIACIQVVVTACKFTGTITVVKGPPENVQVDCDVEVIAADRNANGIVKAIKEECTKTSLERLPVAADGTGDTTTPTPTQQDTEDQTTGEASQTTTTGGTTTSTTSGSGSSTTGSSVTYYSPSRRTTSRSYEMSEETVEYYTVEIEQTSEETAMNQMEDMTTQQPTTASSEYDYSITVIEGETQQEGGFFSALARFFSELLKKIFPFLE